jgi:hypothetical protein
MKHVDDLVVLERLSARGVGHATPRHATSDDRRTCNEFQTTFRRHSRRRGRIHHRHRPRPRLGVRRRIRKMGVGRLSWMQPRFRCARRRGVLGSAGAVLGVSTVEDGRA